MPSRPSVTRWSRPIPASSPLGLPRRLPRFRQRGPFARALGNVSRCSLSGSEESSVMSRITEDRHGDAPGEIGGAGSQEHLRVRRLPGGTQHGKGRLRGELREQIDRSCRRSVPLPRTSTPGVSRCTIRRRRPRDPSPTAARDRHRGWTQAAVARQAPAAATASRVPGAGVVRWRATAAAQDTPCGQTATCRTRRGSAYGGDGSGTSGCTPGRSRTARPHGGGARPPAARGKTRAA